LELHLDTHTWGPPKVSKKGDIGTSLGLYGASNNDYIKGLCEYFLREKKEEKEGDGTVTFEVVETKQQAKKKITSNKKHIGQRNNYSKYTNQNWMEKNKGNRQTGKKKKMWDRKTQLQNEMYRKEMKAKQKSYKELSFHVNPHWPLVDEIQGLTLSNLPKFIPGTPEIFKRAGQLCEYRHEIDSVLSKNRIKFTSFDTIPEETLSTKEISLDENIINYIDEKELKGLKIIASDVVLATLMNYSRSYYSWDIKVEKYDDMIFLTKREKGEKEEFVSVDLETVGENSITPPAASVEDPKSPAALNTAMNLMKEGTKVKHSVQYVCLNQKKVHKFDHPHPYQEDEDQQDLPSHGYTYMRWPFGEGRHLLTRGQIHSFENLGTGLATDEENEDNIKYNNIYAMNQWKMSKDAWETIDNDKTAILSQQLTDNTNRVAKWALQSMFAGADKMKIVFVSRQKMINNKKHAIMGCSTIPTMKFIDLISYKFDESWSNVKYIADYFEKQEDGEYIVIRDPARNCLKVFSVSEEGEGEGDGFDGK